MYCAKETVAAEMFSENPCTIRLLPSFLTEFQQLNPGMYTECFKTGNFRRAILIMNPDCFVKGQGLYGVDTAHRKYRR